MCIYDLSIVIYVCNIEGGRSRFKFWWKQNFNIVEGDGLGFVGTLGEWPCATVQRQLRGNLSYHGFSKKD